MGSRMEMGEAPFWLRKGELWFGLCNVPPYPNLHFLLDLILVSSSIAAIMLLISLLHSILLAVLLR